MQPWIRKYRAETTKDIVGQDTAVSKLRGFISNFKAGKKSVLLYGPTGCGKTVSVYAIAAENNYEVLEVNASDVRNKDEINFRVGIAMNQQSLFSKGKIILVDEVDGLSGRKDRGGASALAKLIDNSSFPIVMTANNPWDQKFTALRKKADMVEFHHLNYISIFNFLKNICKKEGVSYDETLLKSLSRRVGGDLRAAINDLQTLVGEKKELKKQDLESLGERRQTESMMQALVKVFKTTDPVIARSAFENVDEDVDKTMLWIDENLPKEYTRPKDLIKAYDNMSKADVYKGRIRRWQHWRFLVYINDLITAGVALSKDEKYPGFVKYSPTTRILKLWKANMMYMKRKEIAGKIAEKTHISTKTAVRDVVPYMKEIFNKNKNMSNELASYFGFEKEEVEWLRK
ncbi:replication factor C large subunit [Candidatus Woesearchaeota archaeon]|nr:replication factor C large subunit [Candidatus Woesearchaeota archaeon]